jgi:hypothetical protein
MEVILTSTLREGECDQLHPIEQEARLAPEPVCALWERKKKLSILKGTE